MKRIYLQKIEQYNSISYVGKIDPRDLIKVATKIEIGETQDAQRPLSAKRIKEIAKYVGDEKGILPNTLTISTKDSRFKINHEPSTDFFYIEFPNESAEFTDYTDAIDILDGQHRLYSFMDDLRKINDNDKYEIGFTMYICPTLFERRRIFISCNEKQEKVSGNLLMWFREKLNMLSSEEKKLYNIVTKLNQEYPLRGRIILSAEKVANGIKSKEIMNIIKQAKICNISINDDILSEDQIVKLICTYLRAWESVVDFKFSSPIIKKDGPAVKQAGIRYMLLILPTVWDRALTMHEKFTVEFVQQTLIQFMTTQGVVRNEFFTCDENKFKFRDRSVIEQFANESIQKIKTMNAGDFNPLS